MKRNMLDKNGRELKGSARWLREISLDGGMEAHNKKVAMQAFGAFLDSNPNFSFYITDEVASKKRAMFKVVNGKK